MRQYRGIYSRMVQSISCVGCNVFFVDVVAEIKKLFPDMPIVAGGPHPTIDPEDCLQRGGVHVCVIGDGEHICGERVEHMLREGQFPNMEQLKGVRGIAFLDREETEPLVAEGGGKTTSYPRYPLWMSSEFDVEKEKLSE